ncbi:MAG TPA: hypothetical protein VGD59_13195 [Acidisarcina sp.]
MLKGNRIAGIALLLAGIGVLCPLASAQAQDADVKANSDKARATLNAMVRALGGDAWLNLKDMSLEGRTSAFYQGTPTGDITDFWDFTLYPDKRRVELTKKRDWIVIYTGRSAWEVTYRGKKEIPKTETDDYLRRRDHSIDAAIRVWFKDPKTVLIYDQQTMVERHLADQVTLLSPDNDNITIQIDAQDHLPLRCSFEWRDPLYKDKNEDADEFDDYHAVNGIPTPFTVTRFHNGDMTNQRFLYRASYNTGLSDTLFDPDDAVRKFKK